MGNLMSMISQDSEQEQETPKRNEHNESGISNVIVWLGGFAVLGWRANVMWHDRVSVDCNAARYDNLTATEYATLQANGTDVTPQYVFPYTSDLTNATYATAGDVPVCWQFGDAHYHFVGCAAAIGLGIILSYYKKIALKLPFKNSMMRLDTDALNSDSIMVQADPQVHGRWLHQVIHATFCVLMFFFWRYIMRNEPEDTRVTELIGGLTIIEPMFLTFMALVPTVSAQIMNYKAYGYKKSDAKWMTENSAWALASISLKALLFAVNYAILSPVSQIAWSHTDDSAGQRNLVILTVALMGAVTIYFWNKFANTCSSRCNVAFYQGWSYVDFPIFLVIAAQVGWNVTARLDDQHDAVPVTYDFLTHVLYAYVVTLGIFNTVPTKTDPAPRKASKSNTKYSAVGKFDVNAGDPELEGEL